MDELREFRSMFGMVEATKVTTEMEKSGKETFLGGPLRKHIEDDELT